MKMNADLSLANVQALFDTILGQPGAAVIADSVAAQQPPSRHGVCLQERMREIDAMSYDPESVQQMYDDPISIHAAIVESPEVIGTILKHMLETAPQIKGPLSAECSALLLDVMRLKRVVNDFFIWSAKVEAYRLAERYQGED